MTFGKSETNFQKKRENQNQQKVISYQLKSVGEKGKLMKRPFSLAFQVGLIQTQLKKLKLLVIAVARILKLKM
ncbi:hypothetical protein MITS9509_02756 [Synechococcus sp. MIT S9509]|uniref:hypothetical protein n=1 Tax=Synechococcus sp. MIT S9504 TaxID=1801628 RepID=UPI0007BB0FB0|nr:hypothetical protein [Synechococcus sp. MIT S9504]KZR85573.1 hypothetical protein MITS9504_02110 [Synechococcus sp. MIT S9504]KZR90467.1 hypothetical protein MITS9509_02756 [Synechococcus sp. MIT S9509]